MALVTSGRNHHIGRTRCSFLPGLAVCKPKTRKSPSRPLWVFLVPALHLTFLSSSLVREVARLNGDVSDLVHPLVQQALDQQLK